MGLSDRHSPDTADVIRGVGKLIRFKGNDEDIRIVSKQFSVDFSAVDSEINILQNRNENSHTPRMFVNV